LPSESEWEYFARAGTTTEFWGGDTFPKGSANCRECGSKWDEMMTAPVGSFPPNHWQIYDTAGNVTEWVLDHHEKSYENAPNDGSPVTTQGNDRRSQRGGGWDSLTSDLRSAARDYRWKVKTKDDAGFRLVLLPEEALLLPVVK
jgi:formylglycine-generating enzyme required for sulfatase activity